MMHQLKGEKVPNGGNLKAVKLEPINRVNIIKINSKWEVGGN